MSKFNKISWLLPILVGMYFVVFLYSTNILFVSLESIVIALFGVISLGIIIYLITLITTKDKIKSGIVSALCIAGIFSWGYSHIVSIIFLSGIPILYAFKFKPNILKQSNSILIIISVCLMIVPIFNIVNFDIRQALNKREISYDSLQSTNKPDVYYIILDSYTSQNILNSIGYDNSEFIKYLESKGFVVAQDSLCNYPRTYASLASSLNMEYLKTPDNFTDAYNAVQDNKVFGQFKQLGYRIENINSNYKVTNIIDQADDNFSNNQMIYNSFTASFYGTSVFHNWIISPTLDSAVIQRHTILYQLQKLDELVMDNSQPKFVFAHICIPHHSYPLFTANGEPLLISTGETLFSEGQWESIYIQHVQYINNQMEKILDDLFSNSKTKPIIIIQSDEGIITTEYENQIALGVSWINDPKLMLQRSSILNAYYFPAEEGKAKIYNAISPVNSWRVVFNEYFDGIYDLLPDILYYPQVYMLEGIGLPSKDFYDATEVVRNEQK